MQTYTLNKYSQNLFRLILNKFFIILIYIYLYSFSLLIFQYRITKEDLKQSTTNQPKTALMSGFFVP